MMSRSISAMAALGLLVLFALALSGCDGGGNNSVANVRVFNGLIGSVGAGINVSLRNPTTLPINGTAVPFGQISALRRTSSDNAQNTYLFLANSTVQLSAQKFDYPSDNISANTTGELLVATGGVGQSGGGAPQLIYVRQSVPLGLIHNNGQPTANTLLRVVNAAPGLSSSLSIYNDLGTPAAPISDLSNIAFGNYSSGGNTSSNYATLIGATYNLSARDAQGSVYVSLTNQVLQPGYAYTLIVYGSPNTASSVPNAPVAAALVQDYPAL